MTVSKGDKVLIIGEIRYREHDDEVAKGKTKIQVKKRVAEIHAAGWNDSIRLKKPKAANE